MTFGKFLRGVLPLLVGVGLLAWLLSGPSYEIVTWTQPNGTAMAMTVEQDGWWHKWGLNFFAGLVVMLVLLGVYKAKIKGGG